ncbi:MAG TPA: geranylgeranylglycerol-phosphate geranylgeranyltransferase [Bacteroidales bacterium]|nr:geranylgeranylglycerol-phosphate geranylgeranyltransferase [Bacteroidales bacterium]
MLSYIKLFRPVNLLIIAVTQYLVMFCIIKPFIAMNNWGLQMSNFDFALFVFANVLLAAAGYVINDYFDTDTDAINKPQKNMVLAKIPRRQAYLINIILNSIACVIGFYCAYKVGSLKLGFIFIVISLVLYYYSLKYKRQYVTGNIVVALLMAYTVLSVWLFEFFAIRSNPDAFIGLMRSFREISLFVLGLAVFAFLTTLVREIIKDMEDYEGDKACGCDTIPVRKGISFAGKTAIWITGLTMLLLAFAQFLVYKDYSILTWYLCVIQALFIYLIAKILKSKEKSEFHFLSIYTKMIMIAGLLSIQILYTYF